MHNTANKSTRPHGPAASEPQQRGPNTSKDEIRIYSSSPLTAALAKKVISLDKLLLAGDRAMQNGHLAFGVYQTTQQSAHALIEAFDRLASEFKAVPAIRNEYNRLGGRRRPQHSSPSAPRAVQAPSQTPHSEPAIAPAVAPSRSTKKKATAQSPAAPAKPAKAGATEPGGERIDVGDASVSADAL